MLSPWLLLSGLQPLSLHFSSTSSATSVRQPSVSVGLGRAQLSWHGWRGFPEPAGIPAPPVSPGEQRAAVNAVGLLLAPGLWGTAGGPAQLGCPRGLFPTRSRSPLCQLLRNQGIAFGGIQDVSVNVTMGIKGSPEVQLVPTRTAMIFAVSREFGRCHHT